MNQSSSVKTGIIQIHSQLKTFLLALPSDTYAQPLDLLHQNTIGKHCRHILEGLEALLPAKEHQEINYENRKRQLVYEIDERTFLQRMDELIDTLASYDLHRIIHVTHEPFPGQIAQEQLHTSIGRELLYNMEHMIHHMAIIRLAATSIGLDSLVPENFGLAFSTVQHQQK